jgi:hypothetical protein
MRKKNGKTSVRVVEKCFDIHVIVEHANGVEENSDRSVSKQNATHSATQTT